VFFAKIRLKKDTVIVHIFPFVTVPALPRFYPKIRAVEISFWEYSLSCVHNNSHTQDIDVLKYSPMQKRRGQICHYHIFNALILSPEWAKFNKNHNNFLVRFRSHFFGAYCVIIHTFN